MTTLDHYLKPRPRLGRGIWLAVIAFGVGTIILASDMALEADRQDKLRANNEALSASQVARPAPRPRPADLELRKKWAELVAERDFPWRRVFDAVERADRATIELREFKPDKRTRRIILRGEARDADSLAAYLQALASDANLRDVYLVHRQLVVRGTLTTVRFEVKARVTQ